MSDENYEMTLTAYAFFDTHQLMDERVKMNSGHKVEKLRFVSTLTSLKNTFEKGQKITQWYILESQRGADSQDDAHIEEFSFSFTYDDFASTIDTTMEQTCQKLSIFGSEIKKWENEKCPWTSDEQRWNFTSNAVVATVSRPINDFKPINLKTFNLKGGYKVTTPANVAAQTGLGELSGESDNISFVVQGAILANVCLMLLIGVISFVM